MTAAKSPRSVHIFMVDGTEKIVENVPASARLTFGKVNPADKGWGDSWCLRIYTTANNQLAVFTGVREFRDSSLSVKTKVSQKREIRSQSNSPTRDAVSVDATVAYSWVEE